MKESAPTENKSSSPTTSSMTVSRYDLEKVLLAGHYLEEAVITKAKENAAKKNTSLKDELLSTGAITESLLGQAIAESYHVAFADLEHRPVSKESVLKIPEDIARSHNLLLFDENEKAITIATDNPTVAELKAVCNSVFPQKSVYFSYAPKEKIHEFFIHYNKPLNTRFQSIIDAGTNLAPEILHEIFQDAFGLHASDIHFEPEDQSIRLRFRIDGILREAGRIPHDIYENLVNRIKVAAHLRIDEHFAPQDGAIRYELAENNLDMRVSIIPTLIGEKVVIRLLSSYVKGFTLSDIGLSDRNQELLEIASKKPFGMILVTGPTGSGKSTTLYALLKILNKPEVNITTIEDPVEYRINGVNQIQVNQTTGLTFAKGLRSIVRQDPNVILVGEIRDAETAEIAVNAALTGHLLLSTFHANDAATSIPRLLDIGIEPFLLASTLELIIAQRLVRKICESCKTSKSVSTSELKKMYPSLGNYLKGVSLTIYSGKGCNVCAMSGFKGRTAIYEFLPIQATLEDLIITAPSSKTIWDVAAKNGATSLFEDGVDKVLNGVTTIDELLRVASPPQTNAK